MRRSARLRCSCEGKTKRSRDKRFGPKRKVGGRARKAELELLKSFSSLEVHTLLSSQLRSSTCLFFPETTTPALDPSGYQPSVRSSVNASLLSLQWPQGSLPQQSAKWRLKSPPSSRNAPKPFAWPKLCAQPLQHHPFPYLATQ